MAEAKPKGIVSVRSKSHFIAPPGTLLFHNLVDPDNAFDSLKFNVKIGYTEEQHQRLGELIDVHVVPPLWPKFLDACKEAEKVEPKGGWQQPDGASWVADHLKPASDKAAIKLESVQWANEAEFRDRKSGRMVRKTMRAYDVKDNMLDMAELHLGRGTMLQAVLQPGLFVSALVKQPQLSFKLQGIRVLKLVQFGAGAGQGLASVSDEDMALIGDVELDDLSSFAQAPNKAAAQRDDPYERAPQRQSFQEDLDDEIPF